jgi:hypothetical protein
VTFERHPPKALEQAGLNDARPALEPHSVVGRAVTSFVGRLN